MQQVRASEFLERMQETTAIAAIGPSALRNQGAPIIECVRRFLKQLNLESLVEADKSRFEYRLDEETDHLLDVLPLDGWPWGTARNALNLFLCDALYNKYLSDRYNMHRLTPWLEIPLDRATVRRLEKRSNRGSLPIWPGLKHLTKDESEQYQAFAQFLAEQGGIARVHLDIWLWLENRKSNGH